MQYILTQKEYDGLVDKTKLDDAKKALAEARKIILGLSDYPCQETYCDDCPISNFDKYELSKLICPENRNYSK